ncbi:hypothetical protein [Brevibacillus sp. NRS-1366]|uniref:hypothetical protein n=1 Tax=Brevibacillus sp. NRS-1366 TaxID=3233899 RepID=UPI003D1A14CA
MNNQNAASERYEHLIIEEDYLIAQIETYDQMIDSTLNYAYTNSSNLHLETLKNVFTDIHNKNQQAQLQLLHVRLEKNILAYRLKFYINSNAPSST